MATALPIYPDIRNTLKAWQAELSRVNIDSKESPSYSTRELETGDFWLDGKPIYRKAFYIASLPNATTLFFPHGVPLDTMVRLWGTATNGANFAPLPVMDPSTLANAISLTGLSEDIIIETGVDRTSFSAWIILEYTKA